MPKLKHNFVQGKMNKDLDERLVPNGQYRDALNIQVSSSEGSDVGAVENILGNSLINKRTSGNATWNSNFGLGSNAECIGAIADSQNEKIYWFITSSSVDAIMEYDQTTGIVAPILVDTGSELNFNTSYYITGVNVFEGLLAWTDNLNEPRIINIETFKAGSTQSGGTLNTHTSVYGRSFTADDITVIKKGPRNPPTLNMRATRRTGSTVGLGINPVTVTKNFRNPFLEAGDSVSLTFSASPNWLVGDTIVLDASKTNDNNYEDEFRVRIEVTAISGAAVTADIISISANLINFSYTWSAIREEDPPMFESKFVRFAYRWKYKDGQYSTFSPFSKVAFIGDAFKYNSANAHNIGMSNNLRKLTLEDLDDDVTDDVDRIEILYKEANTAAVYKVDDIATTVEEYEITSELIGNILPSSQILRPWDNVPRKALAQEVIGNRLVYGNYLQNFNLKNSSDVDIFPSLSATKTVTAHGSVGDPKESIKSLRTYQLGVVYGDEYGRETPVFTNDDASITIPKLNAKDKVSLKATISTDAPAFADYFKIFIKDISNEYYNIALDRFYAADDGNVWLAFPSAERNKVREGGYLVLKKEHDTNVAVTEDARFKILDISNEAPDDVTKERVQVSLTKQAFIRESIPNQGWKYIKFLGPSRSERQDFFEAFNDNVYIRVGSTDGEVSDYYEVKNGGATGATVTIGSATYTEYELYLKTGFNSDDAGWLFDLAEDTRFHVELYKYNEVFRREYQGKFFTKIKRDPAFDQYIVKNLAELNPAYDHLFNTNVSKIISTEDPNDALTGDDVFSFADYGHTASNYLPKKNSDEFTIHYAPHADGVDASGNKVSSATSANVEWFDDGLVAGNYIKFVNDGTEKYYEIDSVSTAVEVRYASTATAGNYGADDIALVKTVTLTEDLATDPGTWTASYNANRYNFHIYELNQDWSTIITTEPTDISSSNPAIFETEPAEAVDIDIYYEATKAIPIANHATAQTLDYFNCYSFGQGVESNRIRDDFNAPTIDKGVKASSIIETQYKEERKGSSMIFSGLFNSISGVNDLNQFLIAENITKDFNPSYGTIQKLHARDGDLVTMLEDKLFRVLANKDALYNADGNANITSNNNVLGQAVPYAGEYGISKNPESFASFGFRAYFTDKARGTVIRLSRDGITEIADKGMSDYFTDKLKTASKAIGGYDDRNGGYVLAIDDESTIFKEKADGWVSRLSFYPEASLSLNNEFYTFKDGQIWEHSNSTRSNFYGTQEDTTITPIFNDAPSSIKNYKTLSYEGDSGWTATVDTDQQDGEVEAWKKKENLYFNYIKGLATTLSDMDTAEFAIQGLGYPSNATDDQRTIDGTLTQIYELTFADELNTSLQVGDEIYYHDATDDTTKQLGTCLIIESGNVVVTEWDGSDEPVNADFIFFVKDTEKNTSGIIGYYASVKMTTNSGSKKELFAVNSEIFMSSE